MIFIAELFSDSYLHGVLISIQSRKSKFAEAVTGGGVCLAAGDDFRVASRGDSGVKVEDVRVTEAGEGEARFQFGRRDAAEASMCRMARG